jgi:hypothetical protein
MKHLRAIFVRAVPPVFGPGRNKKPSRAACGISAAQTPIASAVYGFEAASSTQQEQREGPHSTYLFARALLLFLFMFLFLTWFSTLEKERKFCRFLCMTFMICFN